MKRPDRTRIETLTALALTALLATGCGQEKPPVKPKPLGPGDVLMTIDGIDISYDEVEPLRSKLVEAYPTSGHKTVVQMLLEDYLVPLKLSQRAFAAERKETRQRALELVSVATNSEELAAQNVPLSERKRYGRIKLPPPASVFLFDPLMTGAVSPPIEIKRGHLVVAAHEYFEHASSAMDIVEATKVGYFTHTQAAWDAWYGEERARVADKVSYVHPDYTDALPSWCKKP